MLNSKREIAALRCAVGSTEHAPHETYQQRLQQVQIHAQGILCLGGGKWVQQL